MITRTGLRRLGKVIFRVIVFYILIFWGCIAFFTLSAWLREFYSADEVMIICRELDFQPDSEFCQGTAWNNYWNLKEALSQQYPVEITTIESLRNTFSVPIMYFRGSSSCTRADENNVCPLSSNCGEGYGCYLDLPLERLDQRNLRIGFGISKEGNITWYYVHRMGS